MNVIPPLPVTPAMLTSSAPEVAPAAYSAGTSYVQWQFASVAGAAGLIYVYQSLQGVNIGHSPTSSPAWWRLYATTYQAFGAGPYSLGDRVIDLAAHCIYESLLNANSAPLSDATKWKNVGASNRFAMFEIKRNRPTVQASPLVVTLAPGVRINSIAGIGMKATSFRVQMNSRGSEVYSITENLRKNKSLGWRDYYYRRFEFATKVARFDLPPYSDATTTVTIENSTGDVEIEDLIIGTYEYCGDPKYDAESDMANYSDVERDGDSVEFQPVPTIPKTNQVLLAHRKFTNRIRALRRSLNGAQAVFCGIPDEEHSYFETLLMKGFYRRFVISLASLNQIAINLELEET